MKNWKFLLLLSIGSLSLICISCEKEEEIEFPITLYGSEVVKVSNIRMFTNKEEIYDTDKKCNLHIVLMLFYRVFRIIWI